MIATLIYLIVVMLVIAVAWWLIDYIPVPAPINRWAKIVVILVAFLIIISILLSLAGVDTGLRIPR